MSSTEKDQGKVTRRGFVKGALTGIGAAAGASVLPTMKAEAQESAAVNVPEEWDLEADVVIIGSGATGLPVVVPKVWTPGLLMYNRFKS